MFLELNLAIRMMLLVLVIAVTIWYSSRGLQNGLLLLLVTSLLPMHQGALFRQGFLPHISLERIVFVCVFLVFVLQWRKRQIKRYPLDLIEYGMFTLLFVIILNMYFHGTYVGSVRMDKYVQVEKLQLFTLMSGFLLPFMAYFMLRRTVVSAAQVKSFLTGVGLITFYLGLTGVGEAFHQGWLVYPKYILDPNMGIHFGKVRGPLVQASWNGLAMAMGLPILLWLIFWKRDTCRWMWLLGTFLVGLSIPYVFQRAAWLSAAAALGIVALTWPKPRRAVKTHCGLMGAVLVAVPLTVLALPVDLIRSIENKLDESGNIDYRYELIQSTASIIGNNNVFMGVGPGKFQDEILRTGLDANYTSHNTALTLLAELGLLGFLPYLFIFGCLFIESAKAYFLLRQSRVIIGCLWAITAAYVIMSMSVELSIAIYPNLLLFALWGALLPSVRQQSAVRQRQNGLYLRRNPTGLRRTVTSQQVWLQPQ